MANKRVLVVDDDKDVRALLNVYLEQGGYEVSFATDGLSCIMQAQQERPDLIVLDLGLPAGDGLSALQRLRKMHAFAQTPVLVLSARDAATWEPRAIEEGANAYLEKPIDPVRFNAAVDGFLRIEPALPQDSSSCSATCPHCGEALEALSVKLHPEAIEELARALRGALQT